MRHMMFRDSISMFRMLHLHPPILCLSKSHLLKPPSVFLFGTHGRSSIRGTEILLDHVGVSSNRNSLYGFRTFCTGQDLSIKKCVPCDLKDLRPMTEEVANGLLQQVAGWNLVNEGGVLKLNRSMKVKSFTKGLELFQLIAGVAEAEGGLTENDFILATKINKLNMHHLLRRKVTD
ncbi:pterin-4-alpha-carbinolamine dehydratase 2, mitochondrial isoform X2 [Castanea sativa]|uniref:pterin-4-alpha-carbinolamine dehydratase 2, mitochondrial isoform X2 n=1 Tax=Castanea sativa TaxID=21020 RepID=UPI003F64C6B2